MPFPWQAVIGTAGELFKTSQANKTTASNNATALAIAQANLNAQGLRTNSYTKMLPMVFAVIGVLLVVVLIINRKK